MGILDPNPHLEEFLILRLPKIIEKGGWKTTYSNFPKPPSLMDVFAPPVSRVFRYKFQGPFGIVKCELEPQEGFVEVVMNGPGGSHEKRLSARRYVKFDPATKQKHLKNLQDLTSQIHLMMFYHGPVLNPQLLPVHIQRLLQYLQMKGPFMPPVVRDQTIVQLNQYLFQQLQLQPMNPQLHQLYQHMQIITQQFKSYPPGIMQGYGQAQGQMGMGAPLPGLGQPPQFSPLPGLGLGLGSGLGPGPGPGPVPGMPVPSPMAGVMPNPSLPPYTVVPSGPTVPGSGPGTPTPSMQVQSAPRAQTQAIQTPGPAPVREAEKPIPEPVPPAKQRPVEQEIEPASVPFASKPELPEECPACSTPIEAALLDDPPQCPACGRYL